MSRQILTSRRGFNSKAKDEIQVDYKPIGNDYLHYTVVISNTNGSKEIIGHVYTEIDGEETRYIATNANGRELYPPTTDFSLLNKNFERHARLVEIEKANDAYYEKLKKQSLFTI